mmetsp:Transcript_19759/g.36805  ORF Transcript_19759/g.36805 Transcript_19759/m.36805 type:complete len:1409 (+) Transcript_19759:114-4340(+)
MISTAAQNQQIDSSLFVSSEDIGHIQVACRVRPPTKREISSSKHAPHSKNCLRVDTLGNSVTAQKPNSNEEKVFQFDYCANGGTTQQQVFDQVGLGITKRCMEGYNGTILCYGQTGTGKTYTMFGPMLSGRSAATAAGTQQGIIPRVLTYLWSQCNSSNAQSSQNVDIGNLPHTSSNKTATFSCSFYEIYQEKIYDLLDTSSSSASASSSGLSVREDAKLGVFVEGCSARDIESVEDAQALLAAGYQRRHTGDTAMNRESSRSHAVFQIYMTITTTTTTTSLVEGDTDGGSIGATSSGADDETVTSDTANSCGEDDETTTSPASSPSKPLTNTNTATRVVTSRFSMVDLAGSERQRDTEAGGGRLKEANVINKSLTALGKVINELSSAPSGPSSSFTSNSNNTNSSTPQKERKKRHVSYRDSKLTFLLKDSLGGTARTVLLATVSAAETHYVESLSTLQFALRARGVCNSFIRQETNDGTPDLAAVSSLQAEVRLLRAKLARYSSSNLSSPPGGSRKRNSLVLSTQTSRSKRNSLANCTPSKRSDNLLKSPLQSLNPLSMQSLSPVVVMAASVTTPSNTTPTTVSPFKKQSPVPLNLNLDDVCDKENSPVNSPTNSPKSSLMKPTMKPTMKVSGVTRQQHEELQTEHNKLQQLHREVEDLLQARDQEMEDLKQNLRERKEELEKTQYELAVAHEQSAGRFTHTKVLLNEMEAANEKNKNFKIEVQALLCSRDALVQELEGVHDQSDKLTSQLNEVIAEKDEALRKNIELLDQLEETESTVNELREEVSSLKEEISAKDKSEPKFRTFSDIQGQNVAVVLASSTTGGITGDTREKLAVGRLPITWMQSFSDSESDSCESVKTSETIVKTPGKNSVLKEGVRDSKACGSRRLSTDSACGKRKHSSEDMQSEDNATCDGSEVDMAEIEAYARDKIDNFSDSESESDLSGSECNSPIKTSTRRRKTLFTVEEAEAEKQGDNTIRGHGFYGSARSPLRAPEKAQSSISSSSSGSFFGALGRLFRSSSSTSDVASTPTSASNALLLASLTTAPAVPSHLHCHVLNEDWKDGIAELVWSQEQEVKESAPCVSPYKRTSPAKKQKTSHTDQDCHILYEVQRAVVLSGLEDEPDFSKGETLGTTTLERFQLQLMECAAGATVYLRVRGVDTHTQAKSLWSETCSVQMPEDFYPSTKHCLEHPGDNSVNTISNMSTAIDVDSFMEFGDNGVFNFLATAGGSEVYQNPLVRGDVHVETSCKWYQTDLSVYVERHPSSKQLEMEDYSRFCRPCSSLILDLGSGRRLKPSAYSLRGFLHKKSILSSWQLEASNDKNSTEWTVLLRHHNDTKTVHYDKTKGFATGTWTLPTQYQAFRYFRLYQLDPTAPNLECSGVELYGTLTVRGSRQFRGKLVDGIYVPE